MRPNPLLQTIQSSPDAIATVTLRCKRRSTFSGDPLVWRPLFVHSAGDLPYGDAGVTCGACECAEAGAAVRVLRSQAAHKVGVQRFYRMEHWDGDGTAWEMSTIAGMTSAPTTVATLSSTLPPTYSTPGVGRLGSELRLAYGDGDKLFVCRSTDDGKTWGAPVQICNGYPDVQGFSNMMLAGANGVWFLLCNAWLMKQIPFVYGFQDDGTGWKPLPRPLQLRGWQPAGWRFGTDGNLYAYLWGVDRSWNSIACGQVKLQNNRFASWWDSPAIVDRTGVKGEVACSHVRLGEGAGAFLFALQETAASGYWFISALYSLPGNTDMEEPVFLGETKGPVANEYFTPLSICGRAFLVGAGSIWASATADNSTDLGIRSYTPISYRYTAGVSGGGQAEIRLARTRSLNLAGLGPHDVEAFCGVFPPDVYVGDILWLDRTWTLGSQSATETLVLRATAVRYGRDHVEVLALDALGVLAHMRARRGKVLREGDRTRRSDVEALCHWAGVKVVGAETLPNAQVSSPGFAWEANESGLGALRRYLADQAVVMRAEMANWEYNHTFVRVLPLPDAPSYYYGAPWGRWAYKGRHELADWLLTHDGRNPRLYVAMGMHVKNSPVAGEGWAINIARKIDGTRPTPVVYVDRSLANDDGTLEGRASAEAARLGAGLSLGWFESTANIGLEVYDVVELDDWDARVMSITETWDRGRLMQHVELAEFNGFGVYQG